MEGLECQIKFKLYNIRFGSTGIWRHQLFIGRVSAIWGRKGSMEARSTAFCLLVFADMSLDQWAGSSSERMGEKQRQEYDRKWEREKSMPTFCDCLSWPFDCLSVCFMLFSSLDIKILLHFSHELTYSLDLRARRSSNFWPDLLLLFSEVKFIYLYFIDIVIRNQRNWERVTFAATQEICSLGAESVALLCCLSAAEDLSRIW